MDAITGDVVHWFNVEDGTPARIEHNSMPASAAAWNEYQLDPPNVVQRTIGQDYVSRVYIPDVHGRVWKFPTISRAGMFRDEGPDHPFGDGVALMRLAQGDFVFGNSGNDLRVSPPPAATPPFSVFGWEDVDGETCCPTPAASTPVAFQIDYPDIFRGAAPPLTVFSQDPITKDVFGRVFFVGVRYNVPGVTCVSSFDAILFALGAETGANVYDFDGDNVADPSTIITGKKPSNIEVKGGRIVIGEQGRLGAAPSPPPPDAVPTPAPPAPAYVNTVAVSSSSPICRQ